MAKKVDNQKVPTSHKAWRKPQLSQSPASETAVDTASIFDGISGTS